MAGILTVVPGRKPARLVPRGGEDTDAAYVNPLWSPDGRKLALTIVTGLDSRISRQQVALVYANGAGLQALTDGPNDYGAAWSPEADRIAFWSERSGGIDVVSFPGGGTEHVVRSVVRGGPAWSPGAKIAFASPRGIEVVEPDGAGSACWSRSRRRPSRPGSWAPTDAG